MRTTGSWTNSPSSRPRVYTEWMEIRAGQVHPRVFLMHELNRVRQSVRTWNATHQAVLSIRRHPSGTEEHPEPHFRVGWDASHTFDPLVVRTSPKRVRKRPKAKKKEDSESESGKEQ